MKILHLMRREKFTKTIADFYNVHFNQGEHAICYLTVRGTPSQMSSELSIEQMELFVDRNSGLADFRSLCRIIRDYDYVVLHSCFLSMKMKWLWCLHPGLFKKTVWIAWGFDLYHCMTPDQGLKSKLKNWITNRFCTKVGTFVGIFPPDCDYFRAHFPRSKAHVFYAPYCGARVDPLYLQPYQADSHLARAKKNGEPIYIQIGHNALPTLHHMEVLELLSRFQAENIRLLLPLNYGDSAYADRVQERAEKLFPGKVICLREMLAKEDYFQLIGKIDIAIFHTERQCALTNIHRMIYNNVKLYMPASGVMYSYFTSQGVPVQPLDALQTCSFENLVSEVHSPAPDAFSEFLLTLSDMERKLAFWNPIYQDLRDRITFVEKNRGTNK